MSLPHSPHTQCPCRQADFLQVEAPLTPAKVGQYDEAVAVWQELRASLEQALVLAGDCVQGMLAKRQAERSDTAACGEAGRCLRSHLVSCSRRAGT